MSDLKNNRLLVNEIEVKKGEVQIDSSISWHFTDVRNALISGNVGTGKTVLLTSMIGQLLSQKQAVVIADTMGANLSRLAYIDDLKGQVFSDFEGTLKAINYFYDEMMFVKKLWKKLHDRNALNLHSESKSYFLIIDEFNYFVEYGRSLSYGSDLYKLFDETMSKLNQISLMGSDFGCYLIISSSLPSVEYLPMVMRNQFALRINMGLPAPEVQFLMFPTTEQKLHPLSQHLKGWGFIQVGNDDVRSFFAPEIPEHFSLFEYVREQLAKRES